MPTFHTVNSGLDEKGVEVTLVEECFEAKQRYFSYRVILEGIVLQNSLVLVLLVYRTLIARYAAKWGIAQMCLPCWWSVNLPEKVSHDMEYRNDGIPISCSVGPLRVAMLHTWPEARHLVSNMLTCCGSRQTEVRRERREAGGAKVLSNASTQLLAVRERPHQGERGSTVRTGCITLLI